MFGSRCRALRWCSYTIQLMQLTKHSYTTLNYDENTQQQVTYDQLLEKIEIKAQLSACEQQY